MKIQCFECKKELKKYISFDFQRGYLINGKFRGQIKYFCSPHCLNKFIDGIDDQPKGIFEPKRLSEWKIPSCIKCLRRNEDSIIINYRESWALDLMRYKAEKNHFCSVNCLRDYLKIAIRNCPPITAKDIPLKERSLTHFRLMIEWANKQPKNEYNQRHLMFKAVGVDWSRGDFDYCAKNRQTCETCPLGDDNNGCCNGLWKDMQTSKTWGDWIKNAVEVVKFIKENG